ncbi:hypothetical protein Anapl_02589 [Anas platyrhynchos]|uniref:Uncharacterized protein n=1 Tax=Anas platyrhynchos TaxID=8839 RepID=R0M4T0_ANAPL|nr:hypothetical protein Anapl_02589 [Anas platyrhynchos]
MDDEKKEINAMYIAVLLIYDQPWNSNRRFLFHCDPEGLGCSSDFVSITCFYIDVRAEASSLDLNLTYLSFKDSCCLEAGEKKAFLGNVEATSLEKRAHTFKLKTNTIPVLSYLKHILTTSGKSAKSKNPSRKMKSPKNCSYFVKAQQNVTETKHASDQSYALLSWSMDKRHFRSKSQISSSLSHSHHLWVSWTCPDIHSSNESTHEEVLQSGVQVQKSDSLRGQISDLKEESRRRKAVPCGGGEGQQRKPVPPPSIPITDVWSAERRCCCGACRLRTLDGPCDPVLHFRAVRADAAKYNYGVCWTLIARLCERKGTKSERLVQSFKTGRGLGKEVQEEVLEKGKHSEVGGLDCRKRRRGGVQCEIQSTRQHCRDHLPREEPMMDNLSRGSTTPSGKMLSSLQPTLPQEQAGYQRDLKKRAESSPISMSGKSSSFIHCIPGLKLMAALEDFAKELKTGFPSMTRGDEVILPVKEITFYKTRAASEVLKSIYSSDRKTGCLQATSDTVTLPQAQGANTTSSHSYDPRRDGTYVADGPCAGTLPEQKGLKALMTKDARYVAVQFSRIDIDIIHYLQRQAMLMTCHQQVISSDRRTS